MSDVIIAAEQRLGTGGERRISGTPAAASSASTLDVPPALTQPTPTDQRSRLALHRVRRIPLTQFPRPLQPGRRELHKQRVCGDSPPGNTAWLSVWLLTLTPTFVLLPLLSSFGVC